MRDGWRLALGTLTAVPVAAPVEVTRRTAGLAMVLAPVAVLPLALLVVAAGLLVEFVDLPVLPAAVLAVGGLAVGTRALHWDGLSDVADGLTAAYDRERSLAVMKSGTSGPAGTVALVVVLLLQVSALAGLLATLRGAVLAASLVCVSRGALALACTRGIPAARTDGLGAAFAGSVRVPATAALWVGLAAVAAWVGSWAGLAWWHGAVAVVATVLVALALLRRTTVRFGGVTGDVMGAGVELALATALLVTVAG
jgi:adenosylcobinamide-GDP ribazoletransferase